ncbi:hypothetical protein MTR67_013894 [Solanum verrucosum]|uniref:Uncharacterized protein n=1 Tax=Solanum verrucosum TaxID=315347 RepID=A0AAF0QIF6_SOLVR|nr:hypothetical protein MTR67_013894 [Solanum verrucosum]
MRLYSARLTHGPSMDLRSVSPFRQPGFRNYFSFQKSASLKPTMEHQYRSLSVAPYLEFSKNQVLEPSQSHSTVQQYGV